MKEHKQKYWKRENKKIDKSNLIEVQGDRKELAEYKDQELIVEGFVTNTIGFDGTKRLVDSVKIGKYYIKHVWMKMENIGKLKHGYQKLKVKVVEYKNRYTGDSKYGLMYIGDKGKMYIDNTLKRTKWDKIPVTKHDKILEDIDKPKNKQPKQPFKKMRKVNPKNPNKYK